jgi:dCTP deaminase
MILSDREVKAALDHGHLVIDPRPEYETRRWSPTSVDLTLAAELREWRDPSDATQQTVFTPAAGIDSNAMLRRYSIAHDCEAGYVLAPRGFVLGWTAERIWIDPLCGIGARVEGKSSLARLGLGIHVTAPTIHPGFDGLIRLEIWNVGPFGSS